MLALVQPLGRPRSDLGNRACRRHQACARLGRRHREDLGQSTIRRRGTRMSLDFLLEIGTEEIPHWMIPGAIEQLAKIDLLEASPRVDATPRRLVVQASGVPEKQPD